MQLDSSNIAQVEVATAAIAEVMDSVALGNGFSNVRLLRSSEEIEAARKHLPPALVPFMIEPQQNSTDVYAFDLAGERGERVVVWNDHAVVADWGSFEAFIDWLRGEPGAA